MKQYLLSGLLIASAVVFLAACNSGGSSAPPPANVTAVAGDSSVTVTWDGTPSVQYWLFFAPGASVTPQSCYSIPGCQIIVNAVSPLVVSAPVNGGTTGFTTDGAVIGLTNGATYSFTLNGRKNSGPGGAGSPSVSATPRLAGSTWTAGSGISAANDMHGVTNGLVTIAGVNTNVFLAVGGSASIYSSTDGSNWTIPASGVPPTTANLNAATSYGNTYLAAGAGGVILTSPDTITWTLQTTGVTSDLYGLASNGIGEFVAVGANGTIIYSNGNGGVTWGTATSGTTNNLYGVTYANGMFVAVGAAGTLLTSPDGITWTSVTALTSADLKSVAYGGATLTGGVISGTNTYVIVGTSGTLITSADPVNNAARTWTLQSAITTGNLNAVVYGHQFIAVGDGGAVYTSTDGASWLVQTSATATNLFAVARRPFDYSIVGGAGLSLYSR